MTTVAVTAASRPLGRAVVARLDADPAVDRILGLDVVEPPMPAAKLEYRPADIRDPVLPSLLDGADVVVNLAPAGGGQLGPSNGLRTDVRRSEETLYALSVGATRNLLAAAGRLGIRKLVHVSSAMAYGAHPDNDVPLTEESPLRASPDFSFGYHALLSEGLVTEWDAAHDDSIVVILRPVTMLGPGVEDAVTHHLESPRLPLVRGLEPPVQFVHLDDVAAAVHGAVERDLAGSYNVAADGWLSVAEMMSVLGRKPLWLPEQVALSAGHQLWVHGLLPVPSGGLHYLMYPWVVSSDRLRATGWSPTRSNREVLREFAASHRAYVSVGRIRLRRRQLYAAAMSMSVASAVLAFAAVAKLRTTKGRAS